jgi:hypothetical protein
VEHDAALLHHHAAVGIVIVTRAVLVIEDSGYSSVLVVGVIEAVMELAQLGQGLTVDRVVNEVAPQQNDAVGNPASNSQQQKQRRHTLAENGEQHVTYLRGVLGPR